MATIKISQLPAITGANTASTDVLAIVDTSLNTTNKITRAEFFKNIQTNVEITGLISGNAVTQTATDTTTGRLTKTGDFGIGLNGDAPLLSNLDAFSNVGSGFYKYDATTIGTYPEGLSGTTGVVVIQRFNSSIIRQTISRNNNDNGILARVYNASGWSRWTQVFTQETLLGTVSQASGVPTGSVFERGSNANGEYVRFADGTQICTSSVIAAGPVTTLAGSIYTSTDATVWTYPATFIAAPSVSGTADNVARWLGIGLPGTTSVGLRVKAQTSFSPDGVARLTAVGRWF